MRRVLLLGQPRESGRLALGRKFEGVYYVELRDHTRIAAIQTIDWSVMYRISAFATVPS